MPRSTIRTAEDKRLANARRVAAFRARQRILTPLQRHTGLEAETLYMPEELERIAVIRKAQDRLEEECRRLALRLRARLEAESTSGDAESRKAAESRLEFLEGYWRVELPVF